MENKILIVDDQFGIRLLLFEVFSKEGYKVFQASNGKTAIELVKKESPNIVILDMKIPGMDGLEILKNIRQFAPDLNVIMMTAYGELDMLEEAKSLGVITYFTKPFDIDFLKNAVADVLNNEKININNNEKFASI